MKKLVSLLLALTMILSLVTIVASAEDRPPVEVTVFRGYTPSPEYNDSMYLDFVKEKFNLLLKYEYAPSSSSTEKLQLAFATNSYPDMVEVETISALKRIAADEFLLDMNQYMEQLSYYRTAFTDSQWDAMFKENISASGALYFLPQKMAASSTSSNVWMYRTAAFKDLGIELPNTTEEFLACMRAFKAANANTTLPNRWGLWNALEGFNIAFRTGMGTFFDIDSNQVEYGPATQKFRDLLVFMNTLYAEDILHKEFITMSGEQRVAEVSKGNVYANFQFAGAEGGLNSWQEATGLPTDWVVDFDHLLLTAYPELGASQQEWPLHLGYGIAITDHVEAGSEKLNRILEYLNWSSSEEGQLFHEYGIQGMTYEIIDGVPTYLPYPNAAADAADPTWYTPLFDNGPFGYYLIQNEVGSAAIYPTASLVNEALKDVDRFYMGSVPVLLSSEEETRLGDITLILTQTAEEWIQEFILGTKNPADDTQWNDFISTLMDLGLEEYLQLYREGNARTEK